MRPSSHHPHATILGLLAATAALAAAVPAHAADPKLRHQEDLHGDVVVFGSTLGFDCGAGVPAPAGATASCANELNTADTAPDLYWRDNVANASITPTQARTSATLVLPPGATVTYARLYWAGLKDGPDADTNATLDWLGGPQQVITADDTWVVPYGLAAHPTWNYYQASGDATAFVSQWGAGDFRVTDVEALPLAGLGYDVDRAFSAWTLVVFYENPGDELKNLALFDSFTPIDPGMPGQGSAEVTLSGFLVPQGFTAKMAAFAYEGDAIYSGDHFTLNGQQLTNGLNPADNFYNSSRTKLGAAVSGQYDVPKLSGQPGSMAGYDLDYADVTSKLKPGDTSATVGADSAMDIFFLGGFITSVQSLAPDFHGFAKDVKDLNGGAVLPGDVLEYTLSATNGGNDTAVNTVITDEIQPGLSFVPGSLQILQGANAGPKTDAAGDDQGEYDAGSKTITVRVGAGGNAVTGGTVAPGEIVKVRFQAKVTVNSGEVANQAIIAASGDAGALPKEWLSDGDPNTVGEQATTIPVDECDTDADCNDPMKPHCDLGTHICIGCTSDADCKDPKAPACQPNGACGECSGSNASLCTGDKPACDTMNGVCVLCTLGPKGDASSCKDDPAGPVCIGGQNGTVHCGCNSDPDCGGPKSGKVCDTVPQTCIDGCRGEGGNTCPDGLVCTSKDSSIGQCVPPSMGAGGGGAGGSGSGGAGGSDASTSSGGTKGGDGDTQDPGDTGGCACGVPADPMSGAGGAFAGLLGLGLLAARRRRRSA